MSNVSLRVYNREIEAMIEGGRLDEAVAHCQHILKTFPMYVEIYRLLGKSFLEARRYTDAADIFQRVIMAVPDDFVAHVGMSIIRDDEGKLDDAIWHMERAFEDQPSNTAIQNELRRLYGRRDGTEPPRIRMSREALANMYAQGELFNQAITEIRAVLADDPNRPDLQVMLARAYYRSGQKVEAAEVAANLLKKYSYCLDALRVLVDVLPEASQTENTQVYRQRLHMLDPYSSFVAGSVFNTDQVADASVNLERLEYVAGSAPTSPQPNWAATLGIKLVDDKRAEPAPDWFTTEKPVEIPAEKPVQKPAESLFEKPTGEGEGIKPILPPSEPTHADSEQSVPDWMRTAGWKESRGQGPEEPDVQSSQKPAEPLEKADIPEWLKSMAPQGIPEPSSAPDLGIEKPASQETSDIPDWLKGLGTAAAIEATAEPSRPQPEPKDTNVFPDWLKDMDASASPLPGETIPEETLEQPISQEMGDLTQAAPTTAREEQANTQPQGTAPAWGDEDTPFRPTGESKPVKIEDDAMAWLESLAAKQGAKEEELLTKPGDRSEEMPDWLRTGKEQAETPASPEPVAVVGETLALEAISQPTVEPVHPEPFPPGIASFEPQVETTERQIEGEPYPEVPETIQENPKPEEHLQENAVPTEVISQGTPDKEIAQSQTKEEDSDAWLKDLMAEQNLHPGEEQSREETSFESLGESPAEGAPLPFNLGEDTQARLDELATGQVSIPEESEPISPAPMEEIPSENISEKIPPPSTLMEDSKAWVEEFPPESQVSPVEISPEVPAEETPPTVPSKVDNDAWSEGLAAPAPETGAEELPHDQVDQNQTQPEWLQTPIQEPLTPSQDHTPVVPSTTPEEDITITSWLSKHDVEAALGKGRSTSKVAPSEGTPKVDLPDWLKEPEQPGTPEKPQESPTQSENAPKADEQIPEWLGQAIRPADLNPETLPAPDITQGEELPTWLDETTSAPETPEATTPGEWISAEEKPGQLPEMTPAAKPAAIPPEPPFQRQILGGTGMLSRIPPEDKDAEFLSAAQTALDAKQIKQSMQAYAKLIKKNRLLDEVIHDLREAIYRFPVDVSIWQTLGDAAMRANRLQDALDAYTKAEELLR